MRIVLRSIITTIVLLLFSLPVYAEATEVNRVGATLGGTVSQLQNDFGFGFEIISPRFAGNSAAISASAALNYIASADWKPYGFASLSLLVGITSPTPTTNLYGKAGVVALFPGDGIADYDAALGALGAFGFEFFFTEKRNGSYYIELGGVGTAAQADALEGSPTYANGFLTNVGVRYYF